jgi:hypothetical protein
VAGGRRQHGIHRLGWLHPHHRSPAPLDETAESADPERVDDTPDEAAPQASLDQVLRRAAKVRQPGREADE